MAAPAEEPAHAEEWNPCSCGLSMGMSDDAGKPQAVLGHPNQLQVQHPDAGEDLRHLACALYGYA